jgi:hypothetical protein
MLNGRAVEKTESGANIKLWIHLLEHDLGDAACNKIAKIKREA